MTGCNFTLEDQSNGPVCGLDEAGRGPLAGPVVAACVYIPDAVRQEGFWADVNDSKKLNAAKRDALFTAITGTCAFGIAQANVAEIDQLNILHASMLAMRRSMTLMVSDYGIRPERALVDGNYKPKLPLCSIETVIGGDASSLSIAAASILAKVTRDRIMMSLCARHPQYGWGSNAGYGTAKHKQALLTHGVTDHHRRSFAPIKALVA